MEGSSSKKGERVDERIINVPPIPERASDKLYNSIVRINVEFEGKNFIGTGFFIKLNIKNKIRRFLMTCHHIIQEKFILENIAIKLYYGKYYEEENLAIKLNRNKRFIKCFDKVDITLIEILEEDNIKEDKFLLPELNYKNGYDTYLNNYFYLAGYPQKNQIEIERSISSGKIINILDNSEFEHSLDTGPGNSGSPICLASNLFVVGIHKQGHKTEPINYGTFLGYILNILEKEEKFDNKIEENNNIIFEDLKEEKKEVKEVKSKKIEIENEDEKKENMANRKGKNLEEINKKKKKKLRKKLKKKKLKVNI